MLADAKEVMQEVHRLRSIRFPVLTPNVKGFEVAIAAGAKEVAVFAAASESLSISNMNCSIEESLAHYRAVTRAANKLSIPVRGYISCVVGCPVDRPTPPWKVAYVAKGLYEMGCFEISFGDTAGVGTPVRNRCSYAKGATGNVATEDVVYMLNEIGVKIKGSLRIFWTKF